VKLFLAKHKCVRSTSVYVDVRFARTLTAFRDLNPDLIMWRAACEIACHLRQKNASPNQPRR
jgi:hypothetical protein